MRAGETYGEERCAVHGELDHLDGGVVAGLDGRVARQRHLGQADGARVGVLAGAENLEGRHHGEAHVLGTAAGAVGAEAHVDVEEGRGVALEPAWLEGDGAACCGPVSPVCCCWVATACERCLVSFELLSFALAMKLGLSRYRTTGRSNKVHMDHGLGNSHGYIHCMPNGNVSLVMRLSPLHPGYVRTVCADDSVAALMSASNVEENIMFVCGCETSGGGFVCCCRPSTLKFLELSPELCSYESNARILIPCSRQARSQPSCPEPVVPDS